MKVFVLSVFAISVFLSSCSKYPDGPTVSLLPRKERIEGKWVAESVKYNSIDSTTSYSTYIWEFTRNYSVILQVNDMKYTGIWSTATNDNDFVIDYDNGNQEKYEIRKMLRDEFWLRNKATQVDFHLRKK